MTAPGQRDLPAEEAHAEWLGWAEASGYRNELAAYGYDDVRDAFTAGMQAARDLAAADGPCPGTSRERRALKALDELFRIDSDPCNPWNQRAMKIIARGLGDGQDATAASQPAAPGAANLTPVDPDCTVCAQVGGPHGVPQSAPAVEPLAATRIHFTTDGCMWLQCFADDPDAENGEIIANVEPGDEWGALAAKVREHQAAHGCTGAKPEPVRM